MGVCLSVALRRGGGVKGYFLLFFILFYFIIDIYFIFDYFLIVILDALFPFLGMSGLASFTPSTT